MYSKIIFLLTAFLAMNILTFADAKKAEDLIEKSIKATGGKEKFENIKTFSLTADMNVPSQNMDINIDFWLKKPNKMRLVQNIASMGMTVEAGTDGDKYWAIQPGSTTKTALPDMAVAQVKGQLDGLKTILDSPLMNYKEKNYKISYSGLEDIDEKKCNVVKIVDEENNETDFYFDAITNLIYCSKSKVNANGEDFIVEMKINEYQKVDGLFIPKRIEIAQNSEVQTKIAISEVKFNPEINDSDFKAE
ncbi:MAG: hypothetical protein KIT33_00600 [Candidatus Kapabacteria bacterium]|nr:hypothetical protein [Ignavibacteriota bacterium]MCW5883446.1 hypothetical protein [Candidatus Kapabacteria bacterium]